MNVFWPRRAYFLAALFLLPIQGCATAPQFLPITGQVIEEGTNKPLPGVIVVAHWLGTVSGFGGHGGTSCRHVETATTDDQGRYRLAFWEDRGPTVVYTYKVGYERSVGFGKVRTVERVLDIMKLFGGTRSEQLKYQWHMVDVTRCTEALDSKRNLLLLYRALYANAQVLAESTKDQEIVDSLLSEIETIELGYEIARDRAIQRAENRRLLK